MKEELDIVIPKTWLQLLLRPRYMAFIQAGIITLYSFGTYYEIRLAERLSHMSLH